MATGEVSRQSLALAPLNLISASPLASAGTLDDLAACLSRARRGVIVCGPRSWTFGKTFAASVVQLAERLSWPLLAEPASQARYTDASPGPRIITYDMLLRDPRFAESHAPDYVLRFGLAPTSKPLNVWLDRAPAATTFIDEEGRVIDPDHKATAIIAAEPSDLCVRLLSRIEPRPNDWLATWQHADTVIQDTLCRCFGSSEDDLWEGEVARVTLETLPRGASLHLGNSLPIRDFDTYAPETTRSAHVFASRGANGIDGTLSTAVGESLATTGPLVLICGELSFLHDVGGLLAGSALGASLCIVVINNGGGGIFRMLPIAKHPKAFEKYFLTPHSMPLLALCRACEANLQVATTKAELRSALVHGINGKGLQIIEARCEPTRSWERREHTEAAVHSALDTLFNKETNHAI
jgi:2-succinyl-5-enolpyruvyl-6-hydroxy-3-cyclohexene-1-carboxylate synthase